MGYQSDFLTFVLYGSGCHPRSSISLRPTQYVTKSHWIQTNLYGWFQHPTVCAFSWTNECTASQIRIA